MSQLLIRGGQLLPGGGRASLLVAGGRIAAIGADAEEAAGPGARRLDAEGLLVAPGFVDLQLNGAVGHDFTRQPEAMWEVGSGLARFGVTAFLATVISPSPELAARSVAAWRAGPPPAHRGAVPIGLHLEGPYIAPARRGAHPEELLRPPSLAETAGWTVAAGVRLVTVAPELPGAPELISELSGRGVVVSLGHSDADVATARTGIEAGARYATHLFNAMPRLDPRSPGIAGAALVDDRVLVGLIADGVHLDPAVLMLAWRAAGPARISVVSDGIAALGLEGGGTQLAGRQLSVEEGAARLPGGTLAGSICPLDQALRHLRGATGASPAEVVATVTANPARLLGLGHGRGELCPGGRADLVLLDAELGVKATLVGGEVAYAAEELAWG